MKDWNQYDHLLGKIPDSQIAAKVGCSTPTVVRRRQKLAIPSHAERLAWTERDALLFSEGYIKCRKCEEKLPIKLFTKNRFAKHGYRKECRDCHQNVIKKRRRKIKQFWVEQMGGRCQYCGFNKWIGPLQFHHIEWDRRNKKHDNTYPNIVLYRKYDVDQIRAELDKCCLLCSNCHDAIHSSEISLTFVKRDTLGWTVSSGDAFDSQKLPE